MCWAQWNGLEYPSGQAGSVIPAVSTPCSWCLPRILLKAEKPLTQSRALLSTNSSFRLQCATNIILLLNPQHTTGAASRGKVHSVPGLQFGQLPTEAGFAAVEDYNLRAEIAKGLKGVTLKRLQPFMANQSDKSVQCLNPSAAHRIFRSSLEQQPSSCNNCLPYICIPESQSYEVFFPKRKRNCFINCLAVFPGFLLEVEGNCRHSAAELMLKCLKCFK